MIRILTYIIILLLAVSCGSTKITTEEQCQTLSEQASKASLASVASTVTEETVDDSLETVTETVVREYDTSKVDSTGRAPLLRETISRKATRKGSKKKGTTTQTRNDSANTESSAKTKTHISNKRESATVETKQPLYYSYLLYGAALVILMAILAFWVFSKYRRRK